MINKEDIEFAKQNAQFVEDEYGDPYELPHYLKMDTPKPMAGKLYDPTFNPYNLSEGGSLPYLGSDLSPANTAKMPKTRKQICPGCGNKKDKCTCG